METGNDIKKELIHKLKRTANPKSGRSFTYGEIGALLGMTDAGAHFHSGDRIGRCPECLRKLNKIGKLTIKETKIAL